MPSNNERKASSSGVSRSSGSGMSDGGSVGAGDCGGAYGVVTVMGGVKVIHSKMWDWAIGLEIRACVFQTKVDECQMLYTSISVSGITHISPVL